MVSKSCPPIISFFLFSHPLFCIIWINLNPTLFPPVLSPPIVQSTVTLPSHQHIYTYLIPPIVHFYFQLPMQTNSLTAHLYHTIIAFSIPLKLYSILILRSPPGHSGSRIAYCFTSHKIVDATSGLNRTTHPHAPSFKNT